MGKANKRNDIILRNILNIANIKLKEKTLDKSPRKAKRGDTTKTFEKNSLDVKRNRNLKR